MEIRLVFIYTLILFAFGMPARAQELTADDLVQKIKSIVDIDFEQEDALKPILGDYVDSINKIKDLIQKDVDQEVIDQKISKLNRSLDMKLQNVLTPDQMHLWDIEKKSVYKDIFSSDEIQD